MNFKEYIKLVDKTRKAQMRCAELTHINPFAESTLKYSEVVAGVAHELDLATAELMNTIGKD